MTDEWTALLGERDASLSRYLVEQDYDVLDLIKLRQDPMDTRGWHDFVTDCKSSGVSGGSLVRLELAIQAKTRAVATTPTVSPTPTELPFSMSRSLTPNRGRQPQLGPLTPGAQGGLEVGVSGPPASPLRQGPVPGHSDSCPCSVGEGEVRAWVDAAVTAHEASFVGVNVPAAVIHFKPAVNGGCRYTISCCCGTTVSCVVKRFEARKVDCLVAHLGTPKHRTEFNKRIVAFSDTTEPYPADVSAIPDRDPSLNRSASAVRLGEEDLVKRGAYRIVSPAQGHAQVVECVSCERQFVTERRKNNLASALTAHYESAACINAAKRSARKGGSPAGPSSSHTKRVVPASHDTSKNHVDDAATAGGASKKLRIGAQAKLSGFASFPVVSKDVYFAAVHSSNSSSSSEPTTSRLVSSSSKLTSPVTFGIHTRINTHTYTHTHTHSLTRAHARTCTHLSVLNQALT